MGGAGGDWRLQEWRLGVLQAEGGVGGGGREGGRGCRLIP